MNSVVARCLDNRLLRDDHAPAERIHRWFGDVLRYGRGPLDRYRLPKATSSSEATLGPESTPEEKAETRRLSCRGRKACCTMRDCCE